jgi:hypothetical protein
LRGDAGDGGIRLTGYASVTGVEYEVGKSLSELIRPGAFKRTLSGEPGRFSARGAQWASANAEWIDAAVVEVESPAAGYVRRFCLERDSEAFDQPFDLSAARLSYAED